MSYKFETDSSRFDADLTDLNLSYPFTIAFWSKLVNHPVELDYAVQLGKNNTNNTAALYDSFAVVTRAVDGAYRATSIDSAGTSNISTSTTADATEFDGKWLPIVCKFTSDASRRIYINTRSHIADVTDTSTRTVVVV